MGIQLPHLDYNDRETEVIPFCDPSGDTQSLMCFSIFLFHIVMSKMVTLRMIYQSVTVGQSVLFYFNRHNNKMANKTYLCVLCVL